jgi:hypothetical protein
VLRLSTLGNSSSSSMHIQSAPRRAVPATPLRKQHYQPALFPDLRRDTPANASVISLGKQGSVPNRERRERPRHIHAALASVRAACEPAATPPSAALAYCDVQANGSAHKIDSGVGAISDIAGLFFLCPRVRQMTDKMECVCLSPPASARHLRLIDCCDWRKQSGGHATCGVDFSRGSQHVESFRTRGTLRTSKEFWII